MVGSIISDASGCIITIIGSVFPAWKFNDSFSLQNLQPELNDRQSTVCLKWPDAVFERDQIV